MPNKSSKDDVNKFLGNFKRLIQIHSLDILWSREKNKETITALGFSRLDVIDEIKKLTYIDYSGGPRNDENDKYPGKIWEFGKIIQCKEIYIKLKLKNDKPLCMSFHFPEVTINYPLKK